MASLNCTFFWILAHCGTGKSYYNNTIYSINCFYDKKNFFSEVIRVLLCDVTFREISTEFFTLSSGKDKAYFFKQKKVYVTFCFSMKVKTLLFSRKTKCIRTQENNSRYEKVIGKLSSSSFKIFMNCTRWFYTVLTHGHAVM